MAVSYQVFENNKPCSYHRFPEGSKERESFKDKGWITHEFDTFIEAVSHLNNWLGAYGPVPDDFQVNTVYGIDGTIFHILKTGEGDSETGSSEDDNILPIKCCDTFIEEVKEESMLCVMTREPFSNVKIAPRVCMLSDGGHGGLTPVDYCPFCGTKIQFTEGV